MSQNGFRSYGIQDDMIQNGFISYGAQFEAVLICMNREGIPFEQIRDGVI